MSTELAELKVLTTLKRRVRQYYAHLNAGQFEHCYRMIDPAIRDDPRSVTRHQYVETLKSFTKQVGKVHVAEVNLELFLKRPNRLYSNRDFAAGETTWEDADGQRHVFNERWVRDGRSWFTRCTGLVVTD